LILGVSISTLRRWNKKGKLKPKYRIFGNQRRYVFEDIINILEPSTCKKENKKFIIE
jgi:DNA-binding transcriptional MerR regulator